MVISVNFALVILGLALAVLWWLLKSEIDKDMREPYTSTFSAMINFILVFFMMINTIGYIVIVITNMLGVI